MTLVVLRGVTLQLAHVMLSLPSATPISYSAYSAMGRLRVVCGRGGCGVGGISFEVKPGTAFGTAGAALDISL